MAISNYAPGQELSSIDFQSMIGGPLGAIVDAQAQAALSTVDFIKSVGFTPDSEDETTGDITPGVPVYVKFKYPKMVAPYEAAINGRITGIAVTSGGSGYSADGTVSITGGEGATVSYVVTGGSVTEIIVTNPGSGYDSSSNVSISGGSGLVADVTTADKAAVRAKFDDMQLEVPILTIMPIPFIRVEEGEIKFNARITSMEFSRVGSKFKASTSFSYKSKGSTGLFVKYSSSVNFKVNASYQRTSRRGNKVEKTFELGVNIKIAQDEIPAGMEKILGILEDAIVAQPTKD